MMKTRSISLVVPVYNEKEVIGESVAIFKERLARFCEDFEIIIVDDGSDDGTEEVLLLLARDDPRIKVLRNPGNAGSGASLWRGFRQAGKELVISNFADRPFDLGDLAGILPLFDSPELDFVVVVRKNRSANPLFRRLTSYGNYLVIRFLFGVPVGDFQFVQCYRRKALEGISVSSRHTFAAAEIIMKAIWRGRRYQEYRADFFPRQKGEAKYSDPRLIARSAWEIMKFYREWRFAGRGGRR